MIYFFDFCIVCLVYLYDEEGKYILQVWYLFFCEI